MFVKVALRDRARLAWAVVFAFISAASLGGGLLGLIPILKLILGDRGQTLPELALRFNASKSWFQIPTWIIAWLPNGRFEGVVTLIIGLLVLTLIGAAANYVHQYLSITLATRTIAQTRLEAFRRVVRMPLSQVVTRGPSEFISRIIRDTAELQSGLIALTSKALAEVTKGIAAFAVAVLVEWRLTLVACIVAPVLAIILRKLGKRIRRGTRGALRAQQELLRIAGESLQGLRTVKAATAEEETARRFDAVNQVVVREELAARNARAISGPLLETLALIVIGFLAVVAAKQIIAGSLDSGRFVIALGSLAVAGASFKPLAGLINQMQAASAPAERLLEILAQPVEEPAAGELGHFTRSELPRHHRSIEFEGVTLRYPGAGGERPAVNDVSLRLSHGRRVAVVGPNGSGKTTLLSLVPRLLVPDAGRVLIDGIDITGVSLASLRRQIAVVTQEPMLFRGSIADNIAFGVDGATRQEIIDAARRAHADSFIGQIPGGYDADLLEQGASLSGGQRQRIVIARAILRDPAILILDEATSQVDADSEAQIAAALSEFCQGRTAFVIAHRLSSVIDADLIVVMDQGRIVDQGTHAELLRRCDLYRALTRTQLVA